MPKTTTHLAFSRGSPPDAWCKAFFVWTVERHLCLCNAFGLNPKGGFGDGLDADTVMRRHLFIWLMHAGGDCPVGKVAELLVITHAAVSRALSHMAPFPSRARAVKDLVLAIRANTLDHKLMNDQVLTAAYATLRGDGWPWARSGKVGNRGRGRPRRRARSK